MLVGRRFFCSTCIAVFMPALAVAADAPVEAPAYQIVLRSRTAEANPTKTKDAQTGGGFVLVQQPEPNTILVIMTGSAVAGSEFHGSSAAISFDLDQALEILPTRKGLRPPRIGMLGQIVGTLNVTDLGKHNKGYGSAEQAQGTASLDMGNTELLTVCVKGASAAAGNSVSVNTREGPIEMVGSAGAYRLRQSFSISASQGHGIFNRQYAVADFDPAPQLNDFWADALRPFRAVVRKDFGFRLALRVVEDVEPIGK
jgi:hypothetical protein